MKLLDPSMRHHQCHYCGSSPVKYSVTVFNGHPITVFICNLCALTHGEILLDILKGEENERNLV